MPDAQGRPTLADLIAEIEDDIERADLNRQVATAVDRAIRHYRSERYFFGERTVTFVTVPGGDVYGRGDDPALPDLMAVDAAFLIECGLTYPLQRISEAELEARDDPAHQDRPVAYSYFDRTLRLWPVPSDEWTVRLTAHVGLRAPALDEANAWTDEAGSLIAAWAKRHLALNSLRDPALATAQDAVVTMEERRLRGRSNVIASSGRIQAYDL